MRIWIDIWIRCKTMDLLHEFCQLCVRGILSETSWNQKDSYLGHYKVLCLSICILVLVEKMSELALLEEWLQPAGKRIASFIPFWDNISLTYSKLLLFKILFHEKNITWNIQWWGKYFPLTWALVMIAFQEPFPNYIIYRVCHIHLTE